MVTSLNIDSKRYQIIAAEIRNEINTLIMPGTVENRFRHILFITMDE